MCCNNLHECSVAQSCQTLCDLMDCIPPGCPVQRVFQVRVLEWVAIAFSIPTEKKCKNAKWLSGEVLQIAVKRREAKIKGEKKGISI